MVRLGTGIGWRPEIADEIAGLPGIDWVEVVAENLCPGHLPDALLRLRERGTTIVPHGVSLGLGGAERPDARRLKALAERAQALGSPLITEHIAFVRAGGPLTTSPSMEAGHLLPVQRTRDALDVVCENIRIAQDALPVPLAVENIAALIAWPGEEMTEGQFLAELVERTGVRLLIDVANLHTNHVNRGEDPAAALDELPVSAIAYVHVAGGVENDGVWHDSHAHPVTQPVLDILAELCARTTPPGVLLERDEDFPAAEELAGELDAIRGVLAGGRRPNSAGATPARPAAAPVTVGAAGTAEPGGAATALTRDDMVEVSAMAEAAVGNNTATGAPGPRSGPGGRRLGSLPDREAGPGGVAAARGRVGQAQAALLSALVAGAPAPEGFDRQRLRVQSRALAAKRAQVVAKAAPELPRILGADRRTGYRPTFLRYAQERPMTSGYRHDALAFAEHLLAVDEPRDPLARRELAQWWKERAGTAPLTAGPMARLAHAVRTAWRKR